MGLSVGEFGENGPTISIYGRKSFTSAWLRRVSPMKEFPIGTVPEDKEYLSVENRRAFDNVMQLLDLDGKTVWINGRASCIDSEFKLRQLEACGRLGIRVPQTLVSNSPAEIRKFVCKLGEVVVKPLDVYTWHNEDGSRLMTYAATLTKEALMEIGDPELAMAPVIYQEVVRNKLDVRAVYVGGDVFASQIKNPNIGSVDFRPHQTDGSLKLSPYSPTKDMLRSLEDLAGYFDIQLASSDFCIDSEGRINFLDLNPGGAFLFVEYNDGGKITSKLASLLGGGSPDMYPGLTEYNEHSAEELRVLNV